LLIVAHAIQVGKNHRQARLSQHNRNIRIWIGNLAVFASKHWLTVREKLGGLDPGGFIADFDKTRIVAAFPVKWAVPVHNRRKKETA
jgi:hypothetical protein